MREPPEPPNGADALPTLEEIAQARARVHAIAHAEIPVAMSAIRGVALLLDGRHLEQGYLGDDVTNATAVHIGVLLGIATAMLWGLPTEARGLAMNIAREIQPHIVLVPGSASDRIVRVGGSS